MISYEPRRASQYPRRPGRREYPEALGSPGKRSRSGTYAADSSGSLGLTLILFVLNRSSELRHEAASRQFRRYPLQFVQGAGEEVVLRLDPDQAFRFG